MDSRHQGFQRNELPQFRVMPFEDAYQGVERRIIFGGSGFKTAIAKSGLRLFKPFLRRNHQFVERADDHFKPTDIREHGITMHFQRFSLLQFNAMILLKRSPEPVAPLQRAAAMVVAALKLHTEHRKQGSSVFGDSHGASNTEQLFNVIGRAFTPSGQCLGIVDASDSKHITVFVRGHAYKLTVMTDDGPLDPNQVLSGLQEIVRREEHNTGETLGPLTALKVKDYAKSLKWLQRFPDTRESIKQIEGSLFVLCLDLDLRAADKADLCHDLYSRNLENRFHLLATQIVVTGTSDVGVIFSHPIGIDGQIMAIFADALFRTACAFEKEVGKSFRNAPPSIEDLPLRRIPSVEKKVPRIRHQVPYLLEFEGFGRSTFKKAGLSPDSAIHIAMMIAARRVFGRVPHLAQFVSMRHFKGGRLSRPHVTPESLAAFVETIEREGAGSAKAKELLERVAAEHARRIASTREQGDAYELCVIPGLDVNRGKPNLLNGLCFLLYLKLFGSDKPDIISSHLRLPDSIQLIGRPGVMFNMVNMFGTHIVLEDHRATLTLMPTANSLAKIHQLRDEIAKAAAMILSMRA